MIILFVFVEIVNLIIFPRVQVTHPRLIAPPHLLLLRPHQSAHLLSFI